MNIENSSDNNVPVEYEYTEEGQVAKVIHPDQSYKKYEYDAKGNLQKVQTSRNGVTFTQMFVCDIGGEETKVDNYLTDDNNEEVNNQNLTHNFTTTYSYVCSKTSKYDSCGLLVDTDEIVPHHYDKNNNRFIPPINFTTTYYSENQQVQIKTEDEGPTPTALELTDPPSSFVP